MSYINLLLRQKADLEDTPEAAKADMAQAEDWSNKSLETKQDQGHSSQEENGRRRLSLVSSVV